MDDWRRMRAADLGRGIEAGRIDPVELTECFLAAAAVESGDRMTYARLTPERARSQAAAAQDRARSGTRRGPLDGVPVSWKDLFDTAGTATESGSRLLEGRVPGRDAAVVATGEAAGLVGLGKTHMSELAFAGLGYNPMTGTPPNVTDPEAVPGGSSSGAAASVAFGLAAAAVGSDTGGSVRVPSSWNDLVGLKTGHGRVSLEGTVPLCPRFDTVGPLTRTVEDAALMLAALEGGKAADLTGATLAGARLAVLETVALDDLDAMQAAAFDTVLPRLIAAGAHLERLRVPAVASAMPLSGPLYTGEAWGIWGEAITANPRAMYARVRQRFEAGAKVSAAEFVAGWRKLEELRAEYLAATAGFDAVILPTTANVAPKLTRVAEDAEYYVAENLRCLRNTRIGNLMGLAGLSLPTGTPGCGLMLLGPPMCEERLLRLGAAAEAALA
ncbi:MAG: amidase [Rhodobacteraceae bacterium]|nr:amidase [Paracoccaceae bacterium]